MNLNEIAICDVETYENYFLIMFLHIETGKVIGFELTPDSPLNINNVKHILSKYTVVTFNGNSYDKPMIEAACQGFNNQSLKRISDAIIGDKGSRGLAPWQVRKQFGIKEHVFDHIDIIEVLPLTATLKIYGGRAHSPKLQDLPYEPDTILTPEQMVEVKEYCGNDLKLTEDVFRPIIGEIELREAMSEEYKVDLRSKSDAQVAEAVIKHEMEEKYDYVPKRPNVEIGTEYRYKPPSNLVFHTEEMKYVFDQFCSRPFVVNKSGYIEFNFAMEESDRLKSGKNKGNFPANKKQLKFMFGDTKYSVGMGGLHSNEKSVRHTNDEHILRDYDVASYYPRIILNNKLFPKHIGKAFLDIYNSIVVRRLKAKREGNKVVDASLKITINGSFGKLGSKWSCLYSPDLMFQVTITGQLTLLMLIERMELAGVKVVSANTDGIVLKFHPDLEWEVEEIVEQWQKDTDYELEGTDYKSLNSRDVNNYIAVKEDSCKGKGAFADQFEFYYRFRSNPSNEICKEAVKAFLVSGTPIRKTIEECKDIRKFIVLRTVNGGAVKSGKIIGKAIRWYYGRYELDDIYYSTNGNKVPKSDGGVPVLDYPSEFPCDVDTNWYIAEALSMLADIGFKDI